MDNNSTRTLHTGNTIPVMGLGTWQLTNDTADTVAHALDLGYHMIDTSGDYGTQPGIAEGLQQSGQRREDLYIVTKVEETDDAYTATQRNLEELGLSYADLLLIHRPPQVGVGETLWQGLIQAKADGLARDIGVSNYSIEQLTALSDATGEIPVVNQIEWSPFGYSPDMLQFCEDNDILIQAYSPLTRTKRLGDPKLVEAAQRHNKTPAQILIRWNLQLGVIPLPKANQWQHMEENIDVFDFELSPADMEELNGFNEYYSSLGETMQYVAS